MDNPPVYSFQHYLTAKKSVDDRALNPGVRQALSERLSLHSPAGLLQVLEIGAGIGSMIERMLEWNLLDGARYTALDISANSLAEAARRLPAWASQRGLQASYQDDELVITPSETSEPLRVSFEQADVFDYAARPEVRGAADLLIAHAVLDLFDVPDALPELFSLLKPGGLFYFTLNFDGVTIFEPTIDLAFDSLVEMLYHRTMDERVVNGRPSGDSRSGRHLFGQVQQAGGTVLAAGASDWVVFAGPQRYPEDEAYFLHFILHFVEQALTGRLELDPARFEAWLRQRHAQVERGELVYIAHQIDLLGCLPGSLPGPTEARS